MDLCDLISENPVEACDQLLAMYNERGEIIKALKAKLSNRDKEIEKIKEAMCVQDTDAVTWIKGIEKIRFDIEGKLQSKEGEEE